MRIKYITDSYPPVVNGVSYVVENLAQSLAQKGHAVEVITIDSTFSLPSQEEINGVQVRRVGGLRPGNSYHIPAPRILHEIKTEADVIHVHNFHSVMPLVAGLTLSKEPKRKSTLVVTPHYHTMGHHFNTRIAWIPYKRLLSRVMKNFDVVHCVSKLESDTVYREFGVRSIVVGNGVPSDVYKYSWRPKIREKDKINVLFVGRLEKYKRIDMLIEAVAIAQKHKAVELKIIGSGSQARSILDLAKRVRVDLELRDYVKRNELLELYSQSNCLVNCSAFEAFSIVTAEALAIGTPVVIVQPWGMNFRNYPRAAIAEPRPERIAEEIINSDKLSQGEKKHVETWNEVAQSICSLVYDKNQAPIIRN